MLGRGTTCVGQCTIPQLCKLSSDCNPNIRKCTRAYQEESVCEIHCQKAGRCMHPRVQEWYQCGQDCLPQHSLCGAAGDSYNLSLHKVWPPNMAHTANQLLGNLVQLMRIRLEQAMRRYVWEGEQQSVMQENTHALWVCTWCVCRALCDHTQRHICTLVRRFC